MNLLLYFTSLTTILLLSPIKIVRAQWLQDYIPVHMNLPHVTSQSYFYQPTVANAPFPVIDYSTNLNGIRIILVYNCFYMKDICLNYAAFSSSPRGIALHPQSGLTFHTYGYDFNKARKKSRRRQSCPSTWKNSHPCPEGDQQPVMRHDGPWFSTALQPETSVNAIIDRVDNGQTIRSNVRYSCDEFPPASWVEGGNNDGTTGANTRCAAIRCGGRGSGTKAEQDWQGTAHGSLRDEIVRVHGFPPGADMSSVVALFSFDRTSVPDGVAARVYTYDQSTPPVTRLINSKQVSQAKRDTEGSGNSSSSALTLDEIQQLVKDGHATEIVTPANDSFVDWAMPEFYGGMQDLHFRWDIDDDINEDEDALWDESEGNEPINRQKEPGMRSLDNATITPLLKRATSEHLQEAKAIVQKAIAESSKLNGLRLATPLSNMHGPKSANLSDRDYRQITPLLKITDRLADAAALVAEAEAAAAAETGNMTKRAAPSSGTYWMGSIIRKGTVPWGKDPNYKVFRNVVDYGAVGDGVTDDTKAIKSAMMDGNRCGENCIGSTTKNAIVYFPPGNYLISTTIALPFGTQVIGDANDRPRLVASSSFLGLGVLSTDEYTGGNKGQEESYTDTANFYRQIRNIVVDITKAGQNISCLHYQIAQATSLQNVELVAKPGTQQIGMFTESGSGGQISDVTFTGGGIGIKGGNQQFTAQRLTFNGCTIGAQVIWDWGWVWKSINMTNVSIGFKLVSDDGSGSIGSVSILDSSFTNVDTAVVMGPPSAAPASSSTGVVLEHVALSGVKSTVADTTGKVLLDGSTAMVEEWALGPVYDGSATSRSFSQGGKIGNYVRQSTLVDSNGAYFERAKPQYESNAVGDFVHIKDLGVLGDGATDDTANFQSALYSSLGKILFIDAGSYILTSTITIPSGARIVGETWSQLVASGPYFSDASNPKVLLKVGNAGDVGNIEMQDLLFTTRGATAGLILVEWNIEAANQGSAGIWDCHARIGGAVGTQLTPAECPPITDGTDPACSAASLMMHLTSSGSGYFENMWLWGADHMIDDLALASSSDPMIQTSIYVARGFLIESTKATWLYATASEHSVFYQYNFNGASNIFAGLLQTESPYFQPTPPPPAPFTSVVGKFPGDPAYTCAAGDEFSGCDESWAVIITKSENILIASAGIYSWFTTYAQSCIDSQQCQKSLIRLDSNKASVRIENLITIGAKYMAVMDGKGIPAADNLNVNKHPFWSQITILDVSSSGRQYNDLIWIDPAIWLSDPPQFTCSPPCHLKIPPWTGATSTVNYPLLTVSSGTWTSTITQAPITISEWIFEVVTLTENTNNKNNKIKRQNPSSFWPTLATTASWPAVAYTGPDGSITVTAPTGTFPAPPITTLGPSASPPPSGSWPERALQPAFGSMNSPTVGSCSVFDPSCQDPWLAGGNSTISPLDLLGTLLGDDENFEEHLVVCPLESSSSSSSTTATKTTATKTAETKPTESPLESGNPLDNKVSCYDEGERTEGVRMQNAAESFCNDIARDALTENYFRSMDFPFNYNGGFGTVDITISLKIKPKCKFDFNKAECLKYLSVPTDSCNCGGVNGKQGGVVSNTCYDWRIDPELSV